MARQRMVTRTICSKEVTVLCLDTVTAEPSNETFTVPCNVKDGEPMLKYLRAKHDTETVKVVSITNIKTIENLYGMSEEEFIKTAKIINKD